MSIFQICSASLLLSAVLVEPLYAQAKPSISIVQQVRELAQLSELNSSVKQISGPAVTALTNAGLSTSQIDSLEKFIADPLCTRPGPRNWCSVQFSPLDGTGLHTPRASLIDSAYVAIQGELIAQPQGLGGLITTPLSPAGYARAAGVADFILERAKDEVVVSFALKFRERLTENDLLRATFTRTIGVSADLDSRSLNQLLPSLRSAFVADLDSLPLALLDENTMRALVDVLKSRSSPSQRTAIEAKFKALKPALPYARAIGDPLYRIARGENPLLAVSSMEGLTSSDLPNTAARAALIAAAIVAREYHVAGADLRTMANDAKSREYLLALFLRDVAQDVSDDAAMRAWTKGLVTNQAVLVQLVNTAHDIESQVDDVRSVAGSEAPSAALLSAGIVHSAAQLVDAIDPLVSPAPAGWQESHAIVDAVDRIQTAVAGRQYVTAVLELNTFALDQFGMRVPLKYAVVLNTASAIAAAQTPEEATAALEAAAEPVLSFRSKRTKSELNGSKTFGINAYAAYAIGSENAFATGFGPKSAAYTGLTVPIGLEWSMATGATAVTSLSLYVPLLDLGTVATFRLNDDGNTDNTPSVTLSQIIAPGAYAVFGLSKSVPVSLGVGIQYVTALRRSDAGIPLNAVRAGGWLGIDVPLFRF